MTEPSTSPAGGAGDLPAGATIDQPGVYDLPVAAYHADPVAGGSLSSTGARMLLPPSCPARYRHWLDEGQQPRREFDFGHAAHRDVLGKGEQLVVIDADDYRTKAAREQRDDAYVAGHIPLLADEHEQVQAMAAAIREHPIAGRLYAPGTGQPEQTLVWYDAEHGVWRRALLDWLPDQPTADGRLLVADYKTAHSADPEAIARAVDQHGYDQQLDWYCAGVRALDLAADTAALLVVQEKAPPYLVTVVQLDVVAMERGKLRNRLALDLYRRCRDTDTWPGYADDVLLLGLPPWAERNHETALERGDYDLEPTR